MQVTDISVLQYCVIKAENTVITIRYIFNMLKAKYTYINGVKGIFCIVRLATAQHLSIRIF
jgi:hypothetical protein